MPKDNKNHMPTVVGANANTLLYRGLSVQGIKNLQESLHNPEMPVVKAQHPNGDATIYQHVRENSTESPYMSFEIGMGVSVGKYAPKPVNDQNKPIGLSQEKDGYLRTPPSYKTQNIKATADNKRIGYTVAVEPGQFKDVDLSTEDKAAGQFQNDKTIKNEADRNRAIKMAVADKEVLLTPEEDGITRDKIALVQKIQAVRKDYYKANDSKQTSTKALAKFKNRHFKIQIPKKYNPELLYKYDFPESNQDDMSSIDSMDLNGQPVSSSGTGIAAALTATTTALLNTQSTIPVDSLQGPAKPLIFNNNKPDAAEKKALPTKKSGFVLINKAS